MKKKLFPASATLAALALGGQALAADLPAKAPPPPSWSWAGFYVGGNVGYSWGRSHTNVAVFNDTLNSLLFAATRSFDMNGVIGGGQIGYNWQDGYWVWGIEADIQGSGQDGRTSFECAVAICNPRADVSPSNVVFTTLRQRLAWFGTVRARLGTTWTPTVFGYVTGGIAYGQIDSNGAIAGFTLGGSPTTSAFKSGNTNVGWTAGAGIEGRLSGNWTGKIEYLYMDLSSASFTAINPLTAPPLRANANSHIKDNILRVGLNYKFDSAARAAY